MVKGETNVSYYEHEIKVKTIENILSRSQEWDWFFSYTEERFMPNINVNSFQDAIDAFNEIYEVFELLCRIREITDKEYSINKDWLKELDQLALYYTGKINIDSVSVDSDLAKIQLLNIHSGKIYSQISNKKFYFYAEIFKRRNIYLLTNIDLFVDEEENILKLLDDVTVDLSVEKSIFEDNINKVYFPSDSSFVERHDKDFLNPDCFSFKHITDKDIKVWEEQEILKMLSISYTDGKLVPLYSKGSYHNPEYEIWNESVLEHLLNYFNTDSTTFIIESVRYILHGIVPSDMTINKHFELLYKLSECIEQENITDLSCSSLELIISFLNDENCSQRISENSFIEYSKVLNKICDFEWYHILFEIKERNALTDKKIRQKINLILKKELDNVDAISNHNQFSSYIQDKKIYRAVKEIHFKKVCEKFNNLIISTDIMIVPTIFLQYFFFLLRIKNNKDIVAVDISTEIIRIRQIWKEEYYFKCKNSMSTIKSGPFSIPKDFEDNYVYYIMQNPFKFTTTVLKLTEDSLVDCMVSISKHPLLLLVARIIIAEDFPHEPFLKIDEKHPIDEFYLKEIEKQIENNGYKLLNVFEVEKFASGIYDRIKNDLNFYMSLLKNVEPMYEEVKSQNLSYEFIDIEDTPTLAHLTQLFPILENKIRNLGEIFSIVPVCESEDKCHRLKEPDSILKSIISIVYEMEGNLEIVSDLFFVHFCMYGENGMNIRNDCIHGNGYYTKI